MHLAIKKLWRKPRDPVKSTLKHLDFFQRKYQTLRRAIFGNTFTYHKAFGFTYGGEGGEAKVESVKELPVFTIGEDRGTRGPDDHREEENHQD